MEYKKSAINLTELAIGIVILGIVVSIGAAILTTVRDSRVTDLPTYTIVNESHSIDTSSFNLNSAWFNSVERVMNTTGATVPTAQYSISTNQDGFATLTNSSSLSGKGDWNVTYSVYNTSDPQFALPQNASAGLVTYGDWFSILVIIGLAGLILGIIFMALSGRGGGDMGSQAY